MLFKVNVVFSFHNPRDEFILNHDVELPLDDNVQLTVEEYRTRLYEVHIITLTKVQIISSQLCC